MEARVGQLLRFEPYADHLQFVLSDAEPDSGKLDRDTWLKSLEAWRIGVERHAIAVATARCDYVPVLFELLARAPAGAALDDVDHAVEADIELPSGKLTITGPTQPPTDADLLRLVPGRYRLRISFAQTDYRPGGSTDAEPGDYLEYRIMMWSVQVSSGVQVLKQGHTRWAY